MKARNAEVAYYSKNIKDIIEDLEAIKTSLPSAGVNEETLAKLKVIKRKIKKLIELNNRKLR